MIQVQFRKNNGVTFRPFNAVSIELSFEKDEFIYTNAFFSRGKVLSAAWRKWTIKLGMINESDMNFLNEMTIETEPEMLLYGVIYGVELNRVNARFVNSSLIVINRAPE